MGFHVPTGISTQPYGAWAVVRQSIDFYFFFSLRILIIDKTNPSYAESHADSKSALAFAIDQLSNYLWWNDEKTNFITLRSEIANSDARFGLGVQFSTRKPNFVEIEGKKGDWANWSRKRLVIWKSES